MNNNNIDELFRKGTKHHYPFDESLWAAVEGQLPTRQTKPLLWIFNLNSIALIAILFLCAIIPMDNTRADKPYTSVSSTHKETIKPSLSTKTTQHQISTTSQINQKEYSKVEHTLAPNTTQEKLIHETPNPLKIDRKKAVIEVNQSENPLVEQTTDPLQKTNKEASPTQSSLQSQKTGLLSISSLTIHQEKQKNQSSFSGYEKETVNGYQKLDFIHSLGFESLGISTLLGVPLTTEINRRNFSTKAYYIELEVNRNVAIDKTVLSSNQNLQKLKQDQEKSLDQSLFGLNFIKQRKHLIYGLGLHHSIYTERVNYLVANESLGYDIRYDTTYRLVSGNFNSNGTPVLLINREINEIRDPSIVLVEDEVVSINTFKRIGIPLFIGVQKTHKNWMAELRTSLSFNYLYQSRGIYLAEDLEQVESINSGAQLESMVVSNKNDLSVGYSFHEQFVLGVRYSLYNDLSSFTKGYESRLRNQSVGVWILWRPE